MTDADGAIVHIVDDDEAVRQGLAFMLGSLGLAVETYPSAADFLDRHDETRVGCAVIDIRMPGMTGLELVEEMNRRGSLLPVIIVTGHGDVPMAVRAMRAGAIDFIEKPANGMALLERVNEALRISGHKQAEAKETGAVLARLNALTPRETEVARAVAEGKQNKVIAFDLGISQKTVEIHRHNAMEKLQARSAADVARMMMAAGWLEA